MTGKGVVDPIKGLGTTVTSVVWSSDSTKLYPASDEFARVFDSKPGKLLHRFQHDNLLYSVALSPKNNVLVCVGDNGVAKLWDTQSLQPFGQLLYQGYHGWLLCVTFSQDGRYVAYGGHDKKLTLWMIKDIAPQLAVPTLLQQNDGQGTQEETRSHSPSSSCLNADATGGDCNIEEARDGPYNNFFQSSHQSLPSASPGSHIPHLFSARRFLNIFSRHRPPADEPVPQERSKRGIFARRVRSDSPLEPGTVQPDHPVLEGKGGGGGEQDENVDDRGSANDPLNTRNDKGKKRDDSPADAQSPPSDDLPPPTELDSADNRNLWKRLMGARGKDSTNITITPTTRRPEVVEVYAMRGFQRYVAMTPKKKKKSLAVPCGAPLVVSHASGSSRPGPSSQTASIQANTSSHPVSGQPGPSLLAVVGHGVPYSQAIGSSSSHASPSHFALATGSSTGYASPVDIFIKIPHASMSAGSPRV
ncbi:hypothetical protein EDB19DRAFT_2046571 [Suillus lakei]|nr:hypothetical protein EDB19DRAFT_2046571 [Suillus lakei]